MRNYRRKSIEQPRLKLTRDASGRLLPSSGDGEINDIWAEQKRIRLAEAIEEDKLRIKKQQVRKEFYDRLKSKVRSKFGSSPKEVASRLSTRTSKLSKFKRLSLRRFSKKQLWIGAIVAVACLLVISDIVFTPKKSDTTAKEDAGKVTTQVLDKKVEKPAYTTLAPAGKSIDSLGGWHRISPPEKEPVFAYVDTLNGVQVNVSQQPLPDSFKKDVSGGVSKLAEQFNAKETVTVDDITAYIGTSEKGPQSVILVKNGLLILMKSTAKLSNDQWAGYMTALR